MVTPSARVLNAMMVLEQNEHFAEFTKWLEESLDSKLEDIYSCVDARVQATLTGDARTISCIINMSKTARERLKELEKATSITQEFQY